MTGHTGRREKVRPATVKQRTLAPQRPKDKYDCKVDPLLSLSHRTHDRPSKGRAENNKSTGRTLQLSPCGGLCWPHPTRQAGIHRLRMINCCCGRRWFLTVGEGERFLHPCVSFLPVPVRVRPCFHREPRFQQQSLVDTI